jgi:hypothetical protein
LLPLAEFAYNNSYYPTIKILLFFACYRFYPHLTCKATEKATVLNTEERISQLANIRKKLETN